MMLFSSARPRANGYGLRIAILVTLMLAGCVGSGSMMPPGRVGQTPAAPAMPAAPATQSSGGATIGNGPVRVALIVPLSGPGQGAAAAESLRNAAELALAETPNPEITILVKDDAGTPDGAREAAS